MKKFFNFIIAFLVMIAFFNVSSLYSQCDKDAHKKCKQGIAIVRSDDANRTTPPTAAWKLPQYVGGTKAMCRFLCENMQYPATLKNQKIKGVATVEFVVRADGSITDVALLKTAGYQDFDDEAVRLVNAFPNWKPAEIECQPEDMKSQVDVVFDLDKCNPEQKRVEKAEKQKIAEASPMEKISQLMPITLYFHNDQPDPKTTAVTTKKSYPVTYYDYYALKNTYKTEYSKGLAGQEKSKAETDMENFFEKNVKAEYEKLDVFTDLLLKELQSGKTVTMNVSGFASPLSNNDYNAKLSSRRISSLKNYLKEFRGGALASYIDSGKLIVNEDPKGESSSTKFDNSDNVNDQKNSVYSIAAAKERKIQIISVR